MKSPPTTLYCVTYSVTQIAEEWIWYRKTTCANSALRNRLPITYETRTFATIFMTAVLYWAKWIRSKPSDPSALRYILNIITTALIYARAFNVASFFQVGMSCIPHLLHFLNSALRAIALRIYSNGKGAEEHWGSRGMAPLILNLGTTCRSVIKLMPRPLYPLGKKPVPSVQKAGWTPEPVWTFLQKRKISCSCRDPIPGQSNP
jgi:hypothetical protein